MNKDSVRVPLSKRQIRIHDKKQACPFCAKLVSKFAEHVEVHKLEPTVAQMIRLTKKGSQERKSRIADMRKRGAFLHNMKVLRQGNGIFIVQRQSSTKQRAPMDYRCCPACLGYYTRQTMPNHTKKCCDKDARKSVKAFNFALTVDKVMDFSPVASLMKDDDITHMALSDNVILHFGKKLYSNLKITGTVTKMESYVSTKMRELARLVLHMCSVLDKTVSLDSLIKAEMFSQVVNGTLTMCNISGEDESARSIPSLALKIGYSLKRCANDMLVSAMEQNNDKREHEIEKFLKLMNLEWRSRVSAGAFTKLKQRKTMKADPLPLAEDLRVCFLLLFY